MKQIHQYLSIQHMFNRYLSNQENTYEKFFIHEEHIHLWKLAFTFTYLSVSLKYGQANKVISILLFY